jgi:VWFA-related protein
MLIPFHTKAGFARAILSIAVAATITVNAFAQRPGERQQPDTVVVNTGDVLLDAIVRNKQGRLVKDLSAADVEVYEDGVRQEINSFRLVSPNSVEANRVATKDDQRKPGNQSIGSIPTSSSQARSQVSAVALVFDRLSPGARTSAYKAALSYLNQSATRDELFGVFLTDLPTLVLQPLTADHDLVKAGIQKAGEHSPSLYTSTNAEARAARLILTNNLDKFQDPSVPKEALRDLPSPTTAPSMTREGAMASLQLGLLERAEEDQRDQLGNATARGLLDIASSLGVLPGRKAVIFFSEGLILPDDVMQTFPAIVNAANRNNVSFYSVDAAGLRTENKDLETGNEIASRSAFRMEQQANSTDSDGPMTKGLERNEDLLRLNPDSGLGRLANETGGFLITNANDLAGKLQKVDEELHSYYLLSYTSNNQKYDGRFRKIEIKVKRSGLDVQGRKGYFAIKSTFSSPVLPYEAPVLAALENQPQANAFSFYARGFSFPERDRVGLAPVIADLPLSPFSFVGDQEKKTYSTDFSVVALLKDGSGQVVEKLSQQYRLSGPLDKLEDEKKGRILFYREGKVAPGSYTLETIAYDAPTGHSSVRTGTLEIRADDETKLRLSDVIIIKRAEAASAADQNLNNPFRVANVIVIPNLGETLSRTIKEAPFFFTVYTPPGTIALPRLTIELRQHDHTLAEMPGDLPKPDLSGRIQYLAGLPLEKLPAGSYELRITVSDGTTTVTRAAAFAIAN